MKISCSPDYQTLFNLLSIDKKSSKPIYIQLSEQISSLIQKLLLKEGSSLPGTRQLANALQLHRKTIVAAYEELSAQGLVTMIANKGTFVNGDLRPTHFHFKSEEENFLREKVLFSIPSNRVLELENKGKNSEIILNEGVPDLRFIHTLRWGIGSRDFLHKDFQSSSFLKHQLIQYVKNYSGVAILEKQILTTYNKDMSAVLITLALLRTNDIVIVGDPGDYKLNMSIQQTGAKLIPIITESDGLDLNILEEFCQKQTIKMVCVSPQNQYPNTVILSYAKRLELLKLASKYGFIILETESESIFDYQKHKIPSLISLDTFGVVVHIHSFEHIVSPAWNISYVLAASPVIAEIYKYKSYLHIPEFGVPERIMTNLLQSGTLDRMTQKTTKRYLQRRNHFCEKLNYYWGKYAWTELPKNGLGVWINFEWNFNLAAFSKKCASKGIEIPHHLLFQSKKWNGMRLGFGSWTEEEAEAILLTTSQLL